MTKMIIKISPVHLHPGPQFHHYLLNGFHTVQFCGYLFFSLYPASSSSGDSAAYRFSSQPSPVAAWILESVVDENKSIHSSLCLHLSVALLLP